jgi:hypothetical protein
MMWIALAQSYTPNCIFSHPATPEEVVEAEEVAEAEFHIICAVRVPWAEAHGTIRPNNQYPNPETPPATPEEVTEVRAD